MSEQTEAEMIQAAIDAAVAAAYERCAALCEKHQLVHEAESDDHEGAGAAMHDHIALGLETAAHLIRAAAPPSPPPAPGAQETHPLGG